MKKAIVIILGLILLPAYSRLVAQPSPCENGVVRMPGGVNGAITICPSIADKNPDLTRQLTSLRSAMSKQQEQLSSLFRLLENVNAVGGSLNQKQQIEMLTRLLGMLASQQQFAPAQLQGSVTNISRQFQKVQGRILLANADPESEKKLHVLMQGDLGNQIAQLDMDRANDQLSGILSELRDINQSTKDTDKNTKALLDLMQKNSIDSPENMKVPMYFAYAPSLQLQRGKLQVWMMHPAFPQREPSLHFIFRAEGKEPWSVEYPMPKEGSGESHDQIAIDMAEKPDEIAICYSAIDPRNKIRRYWSQQYEIGQDYKGILTQYKSAGTVLLAEQESPLCAAKHPSAQLMKMHN